MTMKSQFGPAAGDLNALTNSFGAADQKVAFQMGTDGITTSIPGLGMGNDPANAPEATGNSFGML